MAPIKSGSRARVRASMKKSGGNTLGKTVETGVNNFKNNMKTLGDGVYKAINTVTTPSPRPKGMGRRSRTKMK